MRKRFNNKLSLKKQTISNLEAANTRGGVDIQDSLNETGCAVGVATECPSEGIVTCATHIYYCGISEKQYPCVQVFSEDC